jgi:hypothetical protein
MTVSTSTSTASYTANGSTTTFAYPFKIFADGDLVVILRNTATAVETVQVLNSNYTVTGAGNNAGGNVVFGVAPASGNTVFIRRELPITQEVDYVPNDPFPAETHENALDKLTMLVQQTSVDADRAIVFPASDSGLGLNNILPSVNDRRAKLIQFANDGSVDVIAPADIGNAIIGANYAVDTFTGSGATTIYALSAAPGSTNNTAVYIDGVYQSKSNYSVSGSTLTFTTAPPLNSAIEIVIGDAIPAGAATTAAGVSYTQGGSGAVSRTVQSRLRDFVSVKDFGAVGDGVTDDYTAIAACWTHCLANGVGMHFPAGTYLVNNFNFPMGRINGLPPSSLLDCKNVTIFGDGRSTILKTVSATGADVLQFNGAKNLHVKDLSITADVTTTGGAGSNCVSITGGGDNITFENVYAFNPDYVEYPLYLDGGKGFTIQMTGFSTELGTITFTNCIADGCVYGFDVNPTLNDIDDQPFVSRIDNCIAENCWYGFICSAPAATTLPTGYATGVVIDGTAVNCQHGLTLGRVHGGDYRVQIINTKSKADLKLNPNGVAWSATLGNTVTGFIGTYVKDASILVHGSVNTVDTKVTIGGATSGAGVNGATSNIKAYFDLGGTSDVSDFNLIDSGGNEVASSYIHVTNNTASGALPAGLYSASDNNLIIKGSQAKLQSPILDGSLGFAYTDGQQVLNTIARDSLGLFVQQTGGSSAGIKVFGVKDNAGNQDFVVYNNGGIYSAASGTAASVATVKKVLFFYDNAGNIDGYIPIYTSFS